MIKIVVALAVLLAARPGPATAEAVSASEPPGLGVVPSVTVRGAGLSGAVELPAMLQNWLLSLGLDRKVATALEAQDERIRYLLTNSGQPGVLALVEVERARNETGLRDLVGDQVQVIGAGTEPGSVAIAHAQLNVMPIGQRSGTILDEDASFYYWIKRDGDGVRISTIPVSLIKTQVVHALTEKAFREDRNEKSFVEARRAAVAYLEANLADAERKMRLSSLLKQEAQRQQDIEAVDKRLASELERQRRAQSALTILSTISRGFTLAQQISSFTAALGSDAPAAAAAAGSNQELRSIADKLLGESQAAGSKLQVQETEYRNDLTGTKIEILNVIRENSYPIDGVPQLEMPKSIIP